MFVYKKCKNINDIDLLYIKSINIDGMTKYSSFFAIGGFRFIKYDNTLFNTGGIILDSLLAGNFQNLKTTASSGYSGGYYNVSNMFDYLKPLTGTYANKCYWLSSTASTITATFETPQELKGVQFVPRPDNGFAQSDRGLVIFKLTTTDFDNKTKVYNFSSSDSTRNKIFKIMF